MQLKTAGDLRGFLADVLVGIKDGSIDANKANAISKVAAQINQSMSTEVQTRIHLKKLGDPATGSMMLGEPSEQALLPETEPELPPEPAPEAPKVTPQDTIAAPKASTVVGWTAPKLDGDKVWCEQCEMGVTISQAVSCKSRFCKAKEAA